MRKFVEIPLEVLERLVEGKCVEGSLRRDEWTGKVTFRAYQRQPRERHERVVCQLENGWLKESPQRYKFYNSVRKDLGRRIVDVVMHRELNTAMEELEIDMEALVLIKEVGAYSERQYQRQDGTTEYFKSRGVVLKHGGDEVYGELTGEYASKQRDTQFFENQPYVVKGFWKHRTWQDQNGQTRHENALYITDLQSL